MSEACLSPKIALVTPWFHKGNGGAEIFCGGLAQALHAVGLDVEILTTCCRDPFSDWGSNHLPEGLSHFNRVPVRRFPVEKRSADLYASHWRTLDYGGALTLEQEEELLSNSINSEALYQFIDENREEYLFFFLPYLYGITYHGIRVAGRRRGFIIPCLHNEPIAYIQAMQEMFRRVAGCLFLSQPERDFASALYQISATPQLVLGAGVDETAVLGDAERFRAARKIQKPFILFVGRKVPGKGADQLLSHFEKMIARFPFTDLQLVMIGGGDLEIPSAIRGRVHSFYAENSQDVYDAMAACEFLVQPSFFESFSIVMMEAWLNGKAVVVNGECEVTQYHALKSNGGLYYTSFAEFSEVVELLRSNPQLRRKLGIAGRDYVQSNYNWYDVAVRFQNFLAVIAHDSQRSRYSLQAGEV